MASPRTTFTDKAQALEAAGLAEQATRPGNDEPVARPTVSRGPERVSLQPLLRHAGEPTIDE